MVVLECVDVAQRNHRKQDALIVVDLDVDADRPRQEVNATENHLRHEQCAASDEERQPNESAHAQLVTSVTSFTAYLSDFLRGLAYLRMRNG